MRALALLSALLLVACEIAGEPSAGRTERSADARSAFACAGHYADATPPRLINPKLGEKARHLCFSAYATLHSGVTRTPLYSAEHLTARGVAAAEALEGRDNRFHPEERLPVDERAELSDYLRSGFDRGHLAPSGDMPTRQADFESFSLANIVPQARKLNQRSWSALEREVRDMARRFGDVYVVTGPLFEGGTLRALKRRVLVPTATWKAIYVPGQGAGAWIATNTNTPQWQIVSIDALGRRAGIDPFPNVPAVMKARVPDLPIPAERRRRKEKQ